MKQNTQTQPQRAPLVEVRAYRVRGGAVVRITRPGKVRRYRVGLCRFKRLAAALGCAGSCWSGYFGRAGFEAWRWAEVQA